MPEAFQLPEQLPETIGPENMTQEKGPDRIIPTEDLTTSKKDGCVRIRKTKEWPANRETISLPTIVKKQCQSAGSLPALAVKRDGKWVKWTYTDYYNDIVTTAKAFIALGLEPHNSVCIYGKIDFYKKKKKLIVVKTL